MMVEVFKTNVTNPLHAAVLVTQICKAYTGYIVNFDLEDCDNILRVEYHNGPIDTAGIVEVMNSFGYLAALLADDPLHPDCVTRGIIFPFYTN